MSIRSRSDRIAVLLAAAIAVAPAVARAQETPAPAPATSDDALGALRARFKIGMEHYQAGRFSEAILEWEEIYRKLGPKEGYRLVFNIARAYDARGDGRPAAERYEIYIAEVDARRAAGEKLEPNVEHQAEEASARLVELRQKLSRIHVEATAAMLTKIDREEPRVGTFTVYVEPGAHTLTFSDPHETRTVQAPAGAIVDVDAPKPAPVAPPPPVRYESRTQRPFSPTVLWIAGGVTLASAILPIVAYANASSIGSDFDARYPPNNSTSHDQHVELSGLAKDYDDAKDTFRLSLIAPAACAVVTGALVTWFFVGSRSELVQIQPSATVDAAGARLGVRGAF